MCYKFYLKSSQHTVANKNHSWVHPFTPRPPIGVCILFIAISDLLEIFLYSSTPLPYLSQCIFMPQWVCLSRSIKINYHSAKAWSLYGILTPKPLSYDGIYLHFFVCLFEWTPSSRKESGYPTIGDFSSHPGILIMVSLPSRESWEQSKHSYLLGQFNSYTI